MDETDPKKRGFRLSLELLQGEETKCTMKIGERMRITTDGEIYPRDIKLFNAIMSILVYEMRNARVPEIITADKQ